MKNKKIILIVLIAFGIGLIGCNEPWTSNNKFFDDESEDIPNYNLDDVVSCDMVYKSETYDNVNPTEIKTICLKDSTIINERRYNLKINSYSDNYYMFKALEIIMIDSFGRRYKYYSFLVDRSVNSFNSAWKELSKSEYIRNIVGLTDKESKHIFKKAKEIPILSILTDFNGKRLDTPVPFYAYNLPDYISNIWIDNAYRINNIELLWASEMDITYEIKDEFRWVHF